MRKKPSPLGIQASACPCGSGVVYADCCGRFHKGLPASTAEQLMRARYSAYVLYDNAFIAATWHVTTREAGMPIDRGVPTESGAPDIRWLGLDIRSHVASDDTASVEFVARYKQGGRADRLHEISRFVRDGDRWFYLDGSFPQSRTTP